MPVITCKNSLLKYYFNKLFSFAIIYNIRKVQTYEKYELWR